MFFVDGTLINCQLIYMPEKQKHKQSNFSAFVVYVVSVHVPTFFGLMRFRKRQQNKIQESNFSSSV